MYLIETFDGLNDSTQLTREMNGILKLQESCACIIIII